MILTFHHEVLDNFENVFLKKSISAWPEESHRRCSMKNCVVESFAKFTGKRLCQSLLFNKVADLWPVTFNKRDSGTSVFLWILQNFQDHLFCRTSLDDCFWLPLKNPQIPLRDYENKSIFQLEKYFG